MKRPFKIGERVCATFKNGRFVGEVAKTEDKFTGIIGDEGTGYWLFQTHLVRRLKPKKKAREWQLLFIKATGEIFQHYPGDTTIHLHDKDYELVRVREVV